MEGEKGSVEGEKSEGEREGGAVRGRKTENIFPLGGGFYLQGGSLPLPTMLLF